ncbi:hypothetical protein H312_01232 [Anncaliia algerae PRA339]|uniref:Uncharacterized protein n=1 Tax=Anncaliia algerae PRA339 TaxID=1288291 RepID=A0A059F300_9MICR|nr:hypothetical protein H312_01232 [Anncaliia algerae PRA339]
MDAIIGIAEKITLRKGSFFEKSHLSFKTLLHLMYYFTRDNQKQDNLLDDLEIDSSATIVD